MSLVMLTWKKFLEVINILKTSSKWISRQKIGKIPLTSLQKLIILDPEVYLNLCQASKMSGNVLITPLRSPTTCQ